ncbi:hypothetical protein [Butyrivibrio sp. JL13D10]|uniref:hypothetical protein n=1 Tax=Butyrivibrio sp. JL13D10 TaxID=3236815 RepID=UPI0038B5328E
MIFLEVFIPVLSLSVDVRTLDTGTVKSLISEVCDLVKQKIGENENTNNEFVLYSPGQNRIFPENAVLRECGLITGSKVMLM